MSISVYLIGYYFTKAKKKNYFTIYFSNNETIKFYSQSSIIEHVPLSYFVRALAFTRCLTKNWQSSKIYHKWFLRQVDHLWLLSLKREKKSSCLRNVSLVSLIPKRGKFQSQYFCHLYAIFSSTKERCTLLCAHTVHHFS